MTRPETAAGKGRKRLGDRLVERGRLREEQLRLALEEQKRTGRPIGEVLRGLGFVKEEDLVELLAEDMGVPFVHLGEEKVDPALRAALPDEFLSRVAALPLKEEGGIVTVAMARPSDVVALDQIQRALRKPIRVVAAVESEIRSHLAAAPAAHHSEGDSEESFDAARAVDRLLGRAAREGATDVHVEPEEKLLRTRLRVDGILRAADTFSPEAGRSLVARLKVLAGLDIAEHRRPQDGRFRHRVGGRDIDLRVSTMPTRHGENVVLRLLERSGSVARLDRLDFHPGILSELERVAGLPHGLFLVTGPTGSGKTTTLYSLLGSVNALERKVASIEDPIEAEIPLVRQSQVDPSVGFDFATGLRALLRQDPDVVLVGEIRDRETADIALKASLTGHLVLATLHTNDAIGAFSRLVDMGIEPFLVAHAVCGVLAQRLVRRVCPDCGRDVSPDDEDRLLFDGAPPARVRRGSGCDTCGGSGYRGRLGIHELVRGDARLRRAVLDGASEEVLLEAARGRGFRSMTEDGADKVRAGKTTSAEILRVTRVEA